MIPCHSRENGHDDSRIRLLTESVQAYMRKEYKKINHDENTQDQRFSVILLPAAWTVVHPRS